MKNILKLLFGALFLTGAFFSCKKDENKIFYEGGKAPVLTASSTSAMVLIIANKNNFALKFNWTNPDYQFTTGISSQDVTYTLQFDTTGARRSQLLSVLDTAISIGGASQREKNQVSIFEALEANGNEPTGELLPDIPEWEEHIL